MAPPHRSSRKHVAMRDDNSTISSGLSSGAGLTYTMPKTYRTKSQKPTPVERAQTKQLSKLPLPPPRPKKTRSTRSIVTSNSSDTATVASGTTYTSRVSKVSIKPREPVLKSNDPLSLAMQDKIGSANEDTNNNKNDKKEERKKGPANEQPTAERMQQRPSATKKHGFAPLPEEDEHDVRMEEGIPTQVISTATPSKSAPVVLPPPPPLDSLETYSLGTNDFLKYNPQQSSSCQRNWRLIICIASLLLLAVIAAAVVSVILVLDSNNKNNANTAADNDGAVPSSPAPTVASIVSTPPTTAPPTMPTGFAPIASPVSTTDDVPTAPDDVPNLERLIDLFSEQDDETALALSDPDSAQYLAMTWLEMDVQANQFTLASSQDRILQRGALAIFYYSTLGHVQWNTRTSWLDSRESECTWYGVACGENDASLSTLDLAKNNLGGKVPREVGLLTSLQELTLSENVMGGTIPNQIGQLTLLKTLALDTNFLSGSIPETIGQLSNIETLKVKENELLGVIPNSIASMTLLKTLWLDGNSLVGTLPTSIGLLTRLYEVHLYTNQFTGNIPSELGNLVDCDIMALAENKLSGPIPEELGNMENLRALSVRNNTLTGTVPATLGFLQDLHHLELDGNNLVGEIPGQVCALPNVGQNDAVVADCQAPDPEIECACCSNCPPLWGGG